MNRLLIDTNIVIDLLAKRVDFYTEAAILFSLADKRKLNLFISSLSVANTHYILSKLKSAQEAKDILRKFKTLVTVMSLDDKIVDLALSDDSFKDFEDGLQYHSAIQNTIEAIITRNKKDFKASSIPVFTPKEFLALGY